MNFVCSYFSWFPFVESTAFVSLSRDGKKKRRKKDIDYLKGSEKDMASYRMFIVRK